MGSRSKYRGPWGWAYGKASYEEKVGQRDSWPKVPKILGVITGRRARRLNRARRDRESKAAGEPTDDS